MEVATKASQEGGSYRSILKTTSIIGGASLINMLISMVRTKFVAILLGPSGVGLFGMYWQVIGLVSAVTGMGIRNSGVRQVAEAVGSNDDERIARNVITLRRTAWLTGGLGLLVMVAFCVPFSWMTFGSNEYAWPIAVLGITLLTGAIAGGQECIINGTRRIGDLAKISVIGAINGTLISIPCFYLWRQDGILPSIILSAFASLATSWWFARRVPVKAISFSWRDSYGEAHQLLSLGFSFMVVGLLTTFSDYLIRVVMLRYFGLADVGIYQAALNLSGILVGFVLGAMGADYYPRLTAVAGDNARIHQMVNEQTQISILLSLPGLAAMMIFAPLIIKLFYSASFATAVPVMRWCILGILGRVLSWPMGIVINAKGKGKVFIITETFACTIHLAAVFIFTKIWGLDGAGIAFMVLYVVYTGMILFVMHKLVGATWTRYTTVMILIATIVMALLMLNCTLNNDIIIESAINLVALLFISVLCLRHLSKKSGMGFKVFISKLKAR